MPAARKKTASKKTTTRKKSPARKKTATRKVAKKSAAKKTTKKAARPPNPIANAPKGKKWTKTSVMAELKRCGTAQNRKIFARHGAAGGDFYGVSFANLYAIQKSIKQDHALAIALWNTGNVDAMTLAPMICDPAQFKKSDLDRMTKDITYFMVVYYFARAVAQSPHARACAEKWCASKDELICRSGYDVLSYLIRDDPSIPKADLLKRLKIVEKNIHDAPNRAKEGMNYNLIAMGVHRDDMHKEVIAAAKRIGFVEVDHGDTSCKDFEALVEIPKARAHRKKMEAKRKKK